VKIELLHYTPIEPLIKATAMPYQSKETKGLVKRVFENGHRSIVRHGMASFLISDVSQSLLRQISRHPFINLTVKSSRYCDMSNTNVYIPENNLNKLNDTSEDIMDEYIFDMNKIMDIYKKWKFYEGNQKEVDVAKLFLPLASTTDLVMSGNYQALYEFLQLRNCVRAEREIRQLSLEITEIMKNVVPEIFGELGCKGDEFRICNEFNACGKYPRREE
jgi:thymidylate synthase (FAD)